MRTGRTSPEAFFDNSVDTYKHIHWSRLGWENTNKYNIITLSRYATTLITSSRSSLTLMMKLGGSKKVSAMNAWPVVAQQLQFPAMQYPLAAPEIRDHYLRNLAPYEQVWLNSQQKQFGEQMQANPQRPPNDGMPVAPQASPVKAVGNQPFEINQQYHHPLSNQPGMQPGMQPQANVQPVPMNGFATPPPNKAVPKQPGHQQRSSLSRPPESLSPNGQASRLPSSTPPVQVKEKQTPSKDPSTVRSHPNMPLQHPIEDPFTPTVFPESQLHGPVVIDELFQLGEDITRLKPNLPTFSELGVIDIHALTMSIKSGIHAEIRVALDTLAMISYEPTIQQISLDNCEDLVEALVECAEDQVDFLAENTAEVSDVMLLPSYEEVLRGCRQEMETLLDVPEFGSIDYELDRAVDRLICITTILRNFSFAETNFHILGLPFVINLISAVIRYLGTRNMLLRTHQNTLDFMKDAVIFLSNLSHTIHLPGKDEALCILHFLLSFAPSPSPTSFGPDEVMFISYNPSVHRYLPAAVDSLAKILARDDPNRTYYRAIFSQDIASTPPYDLLSRAFGLSIAPIPEHMRGNILALADSRKPFLMQGMLAAEVLSGFADDSIARLWLESSDGFATSLLRLSCLLSTERAAPPPPPPGPHNHHHQRSTAAIRAAEADYQGYTSIINRSLAVLCRLAQKSKKVDGKFRVPLGVLPKKENLLGALLTPNIDPSVVKQLCEFASFE